MKRINNILLKIKIFLIMKLNIYIHLKIKPGEARSNLINFKWSS